jgi:hypothetical protein
MALIDTNPSPRAPPSHAFSREPYRARDSSYNSGVGGRVYRHLVGAANVGHPQVALSVDATPLFMRPLPAYLSRAPFIDGVACSQCLSYEPMPGGLLSVGGYLLGNKEKLESCAYAKLEDSEGRSVALALGNSPLVLLRYGPLGVDLGEGETGIVFEQHRALSPVFTVGAGWKLPLLGTPLRPPVVHLRSHAPVSRGAPRGVWRSFFTDLGVSLGGELTLEVGFQRSVSVSFSASGISLIVFSPGGDFCMPVRLYDLVNWKSTLSLGIGLPFVLAWLVAPFSRRERERKERERTEKEAKRCDQARDLANAHQFAMRFRAAETAAEGLLVILEARYCEVVDVKIPLQFWVSPEGQLRLRRGSKADMLGFYDPNPSALPASKTLFVRYRKAGSDFEYEIRVHDEDPLFIS